jgi:Protein of unknown function (DUF1579)
MVARLIVSMALLASLSPTIALAQGPPALLQEMVGGWNVEQKMWPGPGAEAVQLPPAVAQRRLIDDKYLEEVMQPSSLASGQAGFFVRNAFLNYNVVNKRYEYYSIDTRAPQAMAEKSLPTPGQATKDLQLSGGEFLAPEWGQAKNVRFKYRLTVGAVNDNRQTVGLYLTPLSVLPKKEFLAFEYKYVRQP